MELFTAPRPDHSPPEGLSSEELAQAIDSLSRKLRSVRASLRTARLAGLAVFVLIIGIGFILLWVGPEPFLPRIFESGDVVTVPTLLGWWMAVILAALFVGIVSYRVFAHRQQVVRGWVHKSHDLERRLDHAESEARRRTKA